MIKASTVRAEIARHMIRKLDIAKSLGVSETSISLVLNERRERPELLDQIRKYVKQVTSR
jgi:predicted transcriptional regulator